MKRLYSNKFTCFLERIYRYIIIYVPCILLSLYYIEYCKNIYTGEYTQDTFDRVTTGVKIAATMAALSFYAGYMTPYETKKPRFYQNGERLFHATALLLVSTMIQNYLLRYEIYNLPEFVTVCLTPVLKICLIVFISYAIYCLMTGITGLLKVLHWEMEYVLHHSKRENQRGAD
jgi:hypothetical protein